MVREGDSGLLKHRYPIPRVPCGKSLDLLDWKGVRIFGSDKELARVS